MGESAERAAEAARSAVEGAKEKTATMVEEAKNTAADGVTLVQETFQEDDRDERTRKSDGRFSRIIVISAVLAVTVFVAATFFLEILNIVYGSNVQLPTEVTVGWFTFWTFEIVMLATIKRSKLKNKFEYTKSEYEK